MYKEEEYKHRNNLRLEREGQIRELLAKMSGKFSGEKLNLTLL